jgi:hypothetical protein
MLTSGLGPSAFVDPASVDPANIGILGSSFANPGTPSDTLGTSPTVFGRMVVGAAMPPLGTSSADLATCNGTNHGARAAILNGVVHGHEWMFRRVGSSRFAPGGA